MEPENGKFLRFEDGKTGNSTVFELHDNGSLTIKITNGWSITQIKLNRPGTRKVTNWLNAALATVIENEVIKHE